MGETIRNAVQLALGGFLSLASAARGADAATPTAPAVEGAYQLGRGEARSGRTIDALLAAYRIGARVVLARDVRRPPSAPGVDAEHAGRLRRAGLRLHRRAVGGRASPATPTSWPRTGRVRQRYLERLAARTCSTARRADAVDAAAERADWEPPTTLTAVIVPGGAGRARCSAALDPRTLQAADDVPELDGGHALLLVPDAARPPPRRRCCARSRGTEARRRARRVRGWRCGASLRPRAARARALGIEGRSTPRTTWPRWCSTPTPTRRADLRARVLAPLADLRPGDRREAHRDAALLAAAPGPPRRRRRRALRARADRALPHGPAARAVRRPARRPGDRARRDAGAASLRGCRRPDARGRRSSTASEARARVARRPPATQVATTWSAKSRSRSACSRSESPASGSASSSTRSAGCPTATVPQPSVEAASASRAVSACSGCHGSRSSPERCTAAAIASHGSSGETGASRAERHVDAVVEHPAQREAALGAARPEPLGDVAVVEQVGRLHAGADAELGHPAYVVARGQLHVLDRRRGRRSRRRRRAPR